MFFATGRPWRWLGFLHEFDDLDPLVFASNGATWWRPKADEVVRTEPIDPYVGRAVLDDVLAADIGALPALEAANQFIADEGYPMVPELEDLTVYTDVGEAMLTTEFVKLVFLRTDVTSPELGSMILPIVDGRLYASWSTLTKPGFVEISGFGVTKAAALRKYCHEVEIDPADIVAFGDGANDFEMLRLAGKGYTMATHDKSLNQFEVVGEANDGAFGRKVMELLQDG